MNLVRLRPVWMTNHPPSVLWHCWLGHQTCKNRRPYNLYCVGVDVKPCSINQSNPDIGATTLWDPWDASPPKIESRGTNTTWSLPAFMTGCNFFDVMVTAWRLKRLKLKLSSRSNGRLTFPAVSLSVFSAQHNSIMLSALCYRSSVCLSVNPPSSVHNDLRPISLLPSLAKVFESIVSKLLLTFLEPNLDDNQFGSRKGRSTTHAIVALHSWMLEVQSVLCLSIFVKLLTWSTTTYFSINSRSTAYLTV